MRGTDRPGLQPLTPQEAHYPGWRQIPTQVAGVKATSLESLTRCWTCRREEVPGGGEGRRRRQGAGPDTGGALPCRPRCRRLWEQPCDHCRLGALLPGTWSPRLRPLVTRARNPGCAQRNVGDPHALGGSFPGPGTPGGLLDGVRTKGSEWPSRRLHLLRRPTACQDDDQHPAGCTTGLPRSEGTLRWAVCTQHSAPGQGLPCQQCLLPCSPRGPAEAPAGPPWSGPPTGAGACGEETTAGSTEGLLAEKRKGGKPSS